MEPQQTIPPINPGVVAPQPVNSPPTVSTQASKSVMESRVSYNWRTLSGSGFGLLTWSEDGHIRLYSIDPSTGQQQALILDILPNQIRKVKCLGTMIWLYLDGKTANLNFSQYGVAGFSGLAGLIWADRAMKKSGGQWWIDHLQPKGVDVKPSKSSKIARVIFFLCLAVFILSILIAVIGHFSASN